MQAPLTESAINAGENRHKVWLVNAPVDLLFCCGGLLWVFIALHSIFVSRAHRFPLLSGHGSSSGENLLASVLLAAAFLFTYPHHAATWNRLYGSLSSIRKYWFCSLFMPLLIIALLILALLNPSLIHLFVIATAVTTMHHWVAQSYGIGMIYFMRSGISLSNFDRRLISISCQTLTVFLALRLLSSETLQRSLSLGINLKASALIPVQYSKSFETAAYVFWAIAFCILLLKWIKGRLMPPLAVIALFASTARALLNSVDSCVDILFYGLPLFHSLQYLVLSSRYYAKDHKIFEETDKASLRDFLKEAKIQRYFLMLFALGGIVYTVMPRLVQFSGLSLVSASALVFLLLNLHHIISDGFIWRLKDPEVRGRV
ncbi:MAG: hypothetical protein K2X27_10655 [Candidatus Obscuribacterales bacterium]|nr:hypothetical protein [Candidatus Obscuribacterales bacterium]